MKVGVISHFDSSHLLPGHPKCGIPHGHTYRIEVTVEGPVKNGMVIDFDAVKSSLKEILREFDHVDLNKILTYPSCENLCLEIHTRLRKRFNHQIGVKVWEGDGKWAEYSE
jgi:6-pyruvoyltetrahydropterin/6-carboxytetrahydropterin synthase